jgi:hypothetical protein
MHSRRRVLIHPPAAAGALVSNVVWPWYTSTWALEMMAGSYQAAADVMGSFYDQFFADGAAASKRRRQLQHQGSGPPVLDYDTVSSITGSMHNLAAAAEAAEARQARPAAPPPPSLSPAEAARMLHARVAGPLVAVQASLQRDTVVWQRGVLATPTIVLRMHKALLVLLDRLTAMQLAMTTPDVSGSFTGGWVGGCGCGSMRSMGMCSTFDACHAPSPLTHVRPRLHAQHGPC